MSRRGSVKKDESGRWMFVIDSRPPGSGTRRQIKRRGFRTKAEAVDALNDLTTQLDNDLHVEPSRLTVADYFDHWLETLPVTGLRTTTIASYRRKVDSYIKPHLGDIRLQDLNAADLDRLYGHMRTVGGVSGRPLSARTVRYAHSIIGKALSDAERKSLVQRNVARLASPPSPTAARAKEPRVWSPQELGEFLAFVETSGSAHYPLLRLAAFTGMRRSELCGLRWDDVDLDGATLTVRRTVTSVDHERVEGAPKSARSRRNIDVDDGTVRILRTWRREQRELRLLAGEGWIETGLVFTMPDGTGWHPDVVSRQFRRLVEASGLPKLSVHGLRHTHTTHLLATGQNPRLVAERLGHSDVAFTLQVYGHVLPGQQADAAAAVAKLVDG